MTHGYVPCCEGVDHCRVEGCPWTEAEHDPHVQALRTEVRSGQPGPGLRSPTPGEAEDLVVRASRIAATTALPFAEALAALRDVTGWGDR